MVLVMDVELYTVWKDKRGAHVHAVGALIERTAGNVIYHPVQTAEGEAAQHLLERIARDAIRRKASGEWSE